MAAVQPAAVQIDLPGQAFALHAVGQAHPVLPETILLIGAEALGRQGALFVGDGLRGIRCVVPGSELLIEAQVEVVTRVEWNDVPIIPGEGLHLLPVELPEPVHRTRLEGNEGLEKGIVGAVLHLGAAAAPLIVCPQGSDLFVLPVVVVVELGAEFVAGFVAVGADAVGRKDGGQNFGEGGTIGAGAGQIETGVATIVGGAFCGEFGAPE